MKSLANSFRNKATHTAHTYNVNNQIKYNETRIGINVILLNVLSFLFIYKHTQKNTFSTIQYVCQNKMNCKELEKKNMRGFIYCNAEVSPLAFLFGFSFFCIPFCSLMCIKESNGSNKKNWANVDINNVSRYFSSVCFVRATFFSFFFSNKNIQLYNINGPNGVSSKSYENLIYKMESMWMEWNGMKSM